MCGIIGYVGTRQATPILIGGLRKLEYRGYDSAGVSVIDQGASRIVRCRGKLSALGLSDNEKTILASIAAIDTEIDKPFK